MSQAVAHETNDADEQILGLLVEGRNLPQNLADELDYSRQYVQNRLQLLKAADYVLNRGGGLYEITEKGREEIGADTDEAAPSAAGESIPRSVAEQSDDRDERIEELEADLSDARARIDELEAALENRPDGTPTSDHDRIAEALDSIERALADLPDSVAGRTSAADARAILAEELEADDAD